MIKYKIVSDKFISEEFGAYIGYGIEGSENNNTICAAYDIGQDKSSILKLTELMNQGDLHIEHFYDIIEDFVG